MPMHLPAPMPYTTAAHTPWCCCRATPLCTTRPTPMLATPSGANAPAPPDTRNLPHHWRSHSLVLLQINASAYTHMPHYWWVKDHPVNKEYHCFKYEKDGMYARDHGKLLDFLGWK